MALNDLDKVNVLGRGEHKKRMKDLESRYICCNLIVDGDYRRLSIKRYCRSSIKNKTNVQLGIISTGGEHRMDLVAKEVYGSAREYWAIVMFNRDLGLSPFRYTPNDLLGFPEKSFIIKQLKNNEVGKNGDTD